MGKSSKELTVKEILELIESVEKDEKDKKAAKKLADAFGLPLDELLKSSKKDLIKVANDYLIESTDVKIEDKKDSDGLLEQIAGDAPTDLRSDNEKTYDGSYKSPDDLYNSDMYTSQNDSEDSNYQSPETRAKRRLKRS